MNDGYKLMALEPIIPEFKKHFSAILRSEGYSVETGKILRAWKNKIQTRDMKYADGVEIKKIWLGPRKHALGILGKRFYFNKKHEKYKDKGESYYYIHENKNVLESEIQVTSKLIENIPKLKFVSVKIIDNDTSKFRNLFVKNKKFCVPPEKLTQIYNKYGFDSPPKIKQISLCSLDVAHIQRIKEFEKKLLGFIEKHSMDIKINIIDITKIIKRIEELENLNKPAHPNGCIIFLLPSKKAEIANWVFEMMMRLQRLGIPYRRAYADDPFEYSVVDQFPSIVTALGGKPHVVDLEINGKKIWSIGIDMSHNTRCRISTLAVTLIDHNGILKCCWRKELNRLDETINSKFLTNILIECDAILQGIDSDIGVIVIRDGRTFENDDPSIYNKIINRPFSFIEYRKRGNPSIINIKDGVVKEMYSASVKVPGTNTLFISSLKAPQKGRPSTTKLVINKKINQLFLSDADLTYFISSSTASPSLGLRPRNLPAAIYWADGIAGISKNDLRFAGQSHIKMGDHP